MKNAPIFFDSHCHFDFSEFDTDRDSIWQRCDQLGVAQLLVPGVHPTQWQKASLLSNQLAGVVHSVGLHPWWIAEHSGLHLLYEQLLVAAAEKNCRAIGECGLDAMIVTPMLQQEKVLALHIDVANELCLPLILHCRKAHSELIALLKKQPVMCGGVIHAFSGSVELARQYWSMGFHLGIGGSITYARANKTRIAAAAIPLDAILLETDAPDMPLSGQQGRMNTPEYIPLIAEELARLRNLSIVDIAVSTTGNAQKLFGRLE